MYVCHEVQIKYVYFSATDSAGTPDTGTQTFTLSVTNVDEQPEFTLTSLVANLNTAPAGKYISTKSMIRIPGLQAKHLNSLRAAYLSICKFYSLREINLHARLKWLGRDLSSEKKNKSTLVETLSMCFSN